MLNGYRLAVTFGDGWVGVVDLSPLISDAPGPLISALRAPDFFCRVWVEDGVVTWPNSYGICSDVLRYWCELGRVCSPEELDEAFARELEQDVIPRLDEAPAVAHSTG